MLVRLAFAVQVQVEPEILIVDEALAVGDALFQKRCFQKITKLVSDGTTLLFVSHDQEIIRTLTSRSLLLDKGTPASWGPTADVILEYRRRLNEEEAAYFSAAVQDLAARARTTEAELCTDVPVGAEPLALPEIVSESIEKEGTVTSQLGGLPEGVDAGDAVEIVVSLGGAPSQPSPEVVRSTPPLPEGPPRSFGNGSVTVERVETLNGKREPCSVFFPGDLLVIRITCRAIADCNMINVGVRIRNKEGIKIYSWGTLNQDMSILAAGSDAPLFWSRHFFEGESFSVILECPCNLGVNLYEIQASASLEVTPDYMSQRILHWVDEAAFFQVLMKKEEHFFGGVVDLRMKAEW
jgi:lipopolysaccharide transport system ATP-binding protein